MATQFFLTANALNVLKYPKNKLQSNRAKKKY